MDYELEMGIFISAPVPFGHTIQSADEAKKHIFGLVMLNDWSARDIQFAEMTPLGPFNGKGSATTISPWVVMIDALDGAEVETSDEVAKERMERNPIHLRHERMQHYTWDVSVQATVKRGGNRSEVSRANLKDLFWSPMQMVSHHASSGCGLRTGDLLGTGTISTVDGVGLGCLHEVNKAGTVARTFGNGEEESIMWLEDGDEVVITGRVQRKDGTWIGFGDCSGYLEPCIEEKSRMMP
jgi:fumarylacetoacetase